MSDTPPVIPFRVVKGKSDEERANEHTVELLEDMLERAQRGEIHTIVMVGIGDGQSVVSASQTPDFIRIIGALELAKVDVIARASQGGGSGGGRVS